MTAGWRRCSYHHQVISAQRYIPQPHCHCSCWCTDRAVSHQRPMLSISCLCILSPIPVPLPPLLWVSSTSQKMKMPWHLLVVLSLILQVMMIVNWLILLFDVCLSTVLVSRCMWINNSFIASMTGSWKSIVLFSSTWTAPSALSALDSWPLVWIEKMLSWLCRVVIWRYKILNYCHVGEFGAPPAPLTNPPQMPAPFYMQVLAASLTKWVCPIGSRVNIYVKKVVPIELQELFWRLEGHI